MSRRPGPEEGPGKGRPSTKLHPCGKVAGSPRDGGKGCPHGDLATGVTCQEVTKDDRAVIKALLPLQPQRERWLGEEEAMTVSTTAKKGEEAKTPRMGVVGLGQGKETPRKISKVPGPST